MYNITRTDRSAATTGDTIAAMDAATARDLFAQMWARLGANEVLTLMESTTDAEGYRRTAYLFEVGYTASLAPTPARLTLLDQAFTVIPDPSAITSPTTVATTVAIALAA